MTDNSLHDHMRMREKHSELKEAGFYHSPVWRKLRRLALQRDHYLCQHCLRNGILRSATEVHHIRPVADWPELALDLDNLVSLCWPCHEQTKVRRHGGRTGVPVRVIKISGNGDEDVIPAGKGHGDRDAIR